MRKHLAIVTPLWFLISVLPVGVIGQSEKGQAAFQTASEEWAKSYIRDEVTAGEINKALRRLGDCYLISKYPELAEDSVFLSKLEILRDEAFKKIAQPKEKVIPYLIADLIANAAIRFEANRKVKAGGWTAPNILVRACEARDEALREALLRCDSQIVEMQLTELKKKLGPGEEFSDFHVIIEELVKEMIKKRKEAPPKNQ